eukprot:2361397-Rhodomonas_salina.1
MSGTDLGCCYQAGEQKEPLVKQRGREVWNRSCYAMSGTDVANAATECPVLTSPCYAVSGMARGEAASVLRSCYAMSGTDLGYAATRGSKSKTKVFFWIDFACCDQ